MNPRHELTAGPDGTAGKEAERQRHLRQRAALPRQDDPGSEQDQPRDVGDRRGFLFPRDAGRARKSDPGAWVSVTLESPQSP